MERKKKNTNRRDVQKISSEKEKHMEELASSETHLRLLKTTKKSLEESPSSKESSPTKGFQLTTNKKQWYLRNPSEDAMMQISDREQIEQLKQDACRDLEKFDHSMLNALGLPVWLAASCTFSQKWLINLFINLKLVNSFVASLTLICTLPRSNHTRWKSSQPLQKTIASKISLSLFPHLSSIVLLCILKLLYLHHGLRPDSFCSDSVSPTYLVFLWRGYLLKHLYTVLLSSWHYW